MKVSFGAEEVLKVTSNEGQKLGAADYMVPRTKIFIYSSYPQQKSVFLIYMGATYRFEPILTNRVRPWVNHVIWENISSHANNKCDLHFIHTKYMDWHSEIMILWRPLNGTMGQIYEKNKKNFKVALNLLLEFLIIILWNFLK